MLTSLKILAVAIAMPVFFTLLPCKITSSILTYLFSYSSLVVNKIKITLAERDYGFL
jgi:hypothetical protein